MDKNTFFAEFKLTEEDLKEANITWEELLRIEEAYGKIERSLREIGKSFIDEYLYDIETAGIHSYRYRTKGVMQLLEKVIRKKKENPSAGTYCALRGILFYDLTAFLLFTGDKRGNMDQQA